MEALSEPVSDRGLARPLLLNNVGTLYFFHGGRARAQKYFTRALTAVERAPEPPLELSGVSLNLAMVTRDPARRHALTEAAWQHLAHALGDAHPRTLRALVTHAQYMLDPGRARALQRDACAAYEYERFRPGSGRFDTGVTRA